MTELPGDPAEHKYYYNTKTGEVERGLVSGVTHRMGPYDTPEEAANALAIARARNLQWEDEEARERAWAEGEQDE